MLASYDKFMHALTFVHLFDFKAGLLVSKNSLKDKHDSTVERIQTCMIQMSRTKTVQDNLKVRLRSKL